MRNLTLLPDACSHFWPISLSSVCHVEPLGASVPSLMTTSARAGSAHNRTNRAIASFFIVSSFSKQVGDPRHQPARPSLRQDVDQSVVGIRVDIERYHFVEQADELLLVLRV